MGHHIVMGRRTYESIARLLPGRTTVIVTRQQGYAVPGAVVAHSVIEAIAVCKDDDEIFVIGGADLFRETLPVADRIYLTTVDADPQGDTFMPDFDAREWRESSAQTFEVDEKHAHSYRLAVLDRLSPPPSHPSP
jgi:dihydrofolate reductase